MSSEAVFKTARCAGWFGSYASFQMSDTHGVLINVTLTEAINWNGWQGSAKIVINHFWLATDYFWGKSLKILKNKDYWNHRFSQCMQFSSLAATWSLWREKTGSLRLCEWDRVQSLCIHTVFLFFASDGMGKKSKIFDQTAQMRRLVKVFAVRIRSEYLFACKIPQK